MPMSFGNPFGAKIDTNEIADAAITKAKIAKPIVIELLDIDSFDAEPSKNQQLGVSYTRIGNTIDSFTGSIGRIAFCIRKVGSPPSPLYVRIRKVSDDSILAESSIDIANVPTSYDYVYFDLTASLSLSNEAIRVLLELSGGDGSNYIEVVYESGNSGLGAYLTRYDTSYGTFTGLCSLYKLQVKAYGFLE